MPQFNEYERDGRRLMVEFKCRRCGGVRIEPLESVETEDGYGYLYNLKKPEGWNEIYGLFCPTCTKEFKDFINARRTEEQ